jgi:hypothetical protein
MSVEIILSKKLFLMQIIKEHSEKKSTGTVKRNIGSHLRRNFRQQASGDIDDGNNNSKK